MVFTLLAARVLISAVLSSRISSSKVTKDTLYPASTALTPNPMDNLVFPKPVGPKNMMLYAFSSQAKSAN